MSKYIFIILGVLFVMESTRGHIFHRKYKETGKNFKGTWQILIILFMTVMGNVILFNSRKDFIFVVFLFMELFYFLFVLTVYPMIYKRCDRLILNDMAFLMCIGMLMISRLDTDKLIKQYIIIWAGTFSLLLIPVIVSKFHKIIEIKWIYCIAGLFLLTAVFVLGKTTFGANLSINIAGIIFQPSELVKLSYVVFIAAFLSKSTSTKQIILTSFLAMAHVGILAISNDLGTGMIFFVTYTVMLYDATHKKRYLLISAMLAISGALAAFVVLPHARVRLMVWTNPFKYIDGKGYQMVQSLFAINSGGVFGSGFTKGLPGSIPVVTKDFIFSAIAEEFGGIFAIVVLLVSLSLFLEIVTILSESNNLFNRYVLGGFGIMFIFQTFLNVGGNINAIPSTGVTLPFVSYGGSSMTSLLIMMGIIQGIVDKNYYEEEAGNGIPSPRMVVGSVSLILFVIVSFVILLIRFDETLLDSTYNRRLDKMKQSTIKGRILSEDGKILAETVINNGIEKRIYPYENMFSHVVGCVNNEKKVSGLEQTLEYKLLHSNQSIYSRIVCDIFGKKYHGNNVTTTLNVELTEIARKALGKRKGAVVVMAKDGAILSMVSYPDFDPNYYNGTDEDESINRATNMTYTPGSVFKIMTLLSYFRQSISQNENSFYNFSYECKGEYNYENISIGCVKRLPHGIVDTHLAFAHSCNGAFIEMGLNIPVNVHRKVCEDFGFNKDISYADGLGLPTLQSSYVLTEEDSLFKKMQTSFGQGDTRITPIHMAVITQMIANEGDMYEPYFVRSIDSYDGKNSYFNDNKDNYKKVLTATEARMIANHMKDVVEVGFPHVFGECGFDGAGKSGTSQFGYMGHEHSLYTGYIPFDNPEIIVSVVLEDFNAYGEPDKYAVDVAKEIFLGYTLIKSYVTHQNQEGLQ